MGRFEKISSTGGGTMFQYYYDAASNETRRYNWVNSLDQIYPRDSLNRMRARYASRSSGPTPTFSAEFYTYDRMSREIEVARAEDGKSDLFWYYWDGNMLGAQYGVTGPDMPEEGGDPDQDMPDTTDPWAGWAGAGEAEGIEPPPFQEEGEPDSPVVEEPDVPMERWVSYFLDNAGNRTRVVETGMHKLYSPNNLNQYLEAESVSVVNGGEHEVRDYQGVHYEYLNDERLKSVTSGSNSYYLYYDALGRCVKRTLSVSGQPSVTTYYIYDGEKPIMEYRSNDLANPARNVYGKWIDEILMRTDPAVNGGAPFYYQQDRNHNVTHLTNAIGAVIEEYKYDAFGAVTVYDGSGNLRPNGTFYKNRFLFTGREYAATFGFYEYRARAYNPVMGRFMSEDPKLFDGGDYSLFRYCHNDPLDRVDPMGLADEHVNAQMVKVGVVNLPMDVGSHIPPLAPVYVPMAALVEAKAQGGVQLRASYAQINQQKLGQLGSVFRPMAGRFIGSANEMLNPEGYEVKIADQGGHRSFAEQARLRAISDAGGPHANKPGESAHNYGAAIDIDIIKGSRAITMDVAPRTYNSLIGRLGALGESQGLIWGGHFTKPDLPHFQYPGIPVNGPDILRLHQRLLRTTGTGLDTLMGIP